MQVDISKKINKPTKRAPKPMKVKKLTPTQIALNLLRETAVVSFQVNVDKENNFFYTITRGQKVKKLDGSTHIIYDDKVIKLNVDMNNIDHLSLIPNLAVIAKDEVTKRLDFVTNINDKVKSHSVESILYKYILSKCDSLSVKDMTIHLKPSVISHVSDQKPSSTDA